MTSINTDKLVQSMRLGKIEREHKSLGKLILLSNFSNISIIIN